jgi:hypothetical protein
MSHVGALRTYTAQDKLECVERELRFRFRVYHRRVNNGEMNTQLAKHEIDIMEAICEDYRQQAAKERLL